MEYLMTYGWAILIIAVVLGALFQLGVFNAGTFAPRAPPGACQVFRPNGPGTSSLINLEGVCSGELPQYVAVFNGQGSNYITVGSPSFGASSLQQFTVSFWAEYPGSFSYSGNNPPYYGFFKTYADAIYLFTPNVDQIQLFLNNVNPGPGSVVSIVTPYTWSNFMLTYNGYSAVLYQNTNTVMTVSNSMQINSFSSLFIGTGDSGTFKGSMANFQFYNTSLSGPEVNALYDEGIGGAPIRLQNLVGWWPLNGNANDYSGNNNNGVPSGVTYTNQWTSGYTPP